MPAEDAIIARSRENLFAVRERIAEACSRAGTLKVGGLTAFA